MHPLHTDIRKSSDVPGAARVYISVRSREADAMTTQTYTYPTQAELAEIKLRARQMQAETIRAGFHALVHWIAHPTLHPRHA